MSIQYIFQYCYVIGADVSFETMFSTHPINLVVEEISQKKSVFQTPIAYFINENEKRVPILHNSILALMKSGAPFFCIDIICMIYLDLTYFSVVCLSIYYDKLAVKTKHKRWNISSERS